METVYHFIEVAETAIKSYFDFFYGEKAYDFSLVESEEAYIEARGEWIDPVGREVQLITTFESLYNESQNVDIGLLVCKIEKVLLNINDIDRKVFMKRLIRKMIFLSKFNVYAIDEILAIEMYIEGLELVDVIYGLESYKEDGYEYPDLVAEIEKYYSCTREITIKIISLLREIKIVCDDFSLDFTSISLECNCVGLESLITPFSFKKEIDSTEKSTKKKKNEFTNHRKKIAIMALLDGLGVRAGYGGDIPLTEAKRFVHFLIGIGTKEDPINNQSAAKLFDIERNEEIYKKDCLFVAEYFDKLGLAELSSKIRNGI